MDIIFIRSVLAIFLSVFIVVAPVSANDREKNGRNKHHDKNRFDGYSHHDDKSGQYDKNKKRKEWKGRHKGCNIKGKHYHDDHNAPLNCQDAVSAPSKLWPANHKFKKINIDGLSTSDGSAPSITYQCVFQDEPLNAEGDGNTDVDAKINSGDLFLRKERAGNGNGRVYHVDFLATDNSNGDSCEGTVVVEVPHNKKGMAKDDGRLYTSLAIGSNCGDSENQVPMITSNPVIDTTATLDYTYSVIATDADNDVLGYELVESPEGMTIDSDGIISWTPNDLQVGNHAVSIAIDDGNGGQATQDYIVSVTARPNSAPVISSTPVLDATEAQAYSYSVQAADPDGDAISFSLSLAPTGMEINESGLIQWAPMVGQAGDHSVSLLVTDIYGAIAQQDFVIVVSPKPNDAPVITSTPVIEVAEGDNYLYVITVMDPNNDPVTLSLIQAPIGLVLNQNTLSWNPDFNQAGEYPISILATDSNGASASQSYTLTVLDTNQLPVITSSPLLITNEGEFYQYLVVANDADGDALQYSLELAPEGMLISDSGLIEWLPGYELAGAHEVHVEVDDGKQGTATQHFSLDVINTNRDPQITSQPIITATENIQYLYQVTTNDDDGDVIQFNLANAPAGMIIANDGLISWLPDYNTAGDHTVDVEITDGIATVIQTFVITVININQPPISDDISVATDEDNAVVITLTASDSDGDALTFAIETDPQHGTVVLNANEATYTPAVNFNGQDTFTFTSNDGTTNSNSATVTIDIAPINDLPVFNSLPTTTATENQSYASFVSAIDIDGDVLTYSLNAGPLGLAINSVTGEINWAPSFEQSGSHPVTISVSDGTVTQSLNFEIVVANVNRAPTISSAPVVTANENEIYSYQVIAQDVDNDVLNYSLNQSPAGMTINSLTGLIEWTTTFESAGNYSVVVLVNDANGGSAQQTFTVGVANVNRTPVASSQNLTVNEDENLSFSIFGFDEDGQTLSYIVVDQPSNGTLSGQLPDVVYTPNQNFSGTDTFTFKVSDTVEESAIATVTIDVTSVNDLPEFTSLPTTPATENQSYTAQIIATDIDGDLLTYSLDVGPAGLFINPMTGEISWTPNFDQAGSHSITVSVTDSIGVPVIGTFSIEVINSNRAPIISDIPPQTINKNQPYQYLITVIDPDNDPISFELNSAPQGMQIDAGGLITWSPSLQILGTFPISISAIDPQGGTASQNFSLEVVDGNQAPSIISTPTAFVVLGDNWNYMLEAEDLDGDAITLAMLQGPDGVNFDPSTGQVDWATASVAAGSYTFHFAVSDSEGAQSEQVFSVEVLSDVLTNSHEGKEFWFPASINFKAIGATYYIFVVSRHDNTDVTIDWPAVGVSEQLTLTKNEISTYSVDAVELENAGVLQTQMVLENSAVHITASNDTIVYVMNNKEFTTDGHLVLPVNALGKSYIVGDYFPDSNLSDSRTRNPIIGFVATEDNTTISMKAPMDIFPSDYERLKVGNVFTLNLNQGDVYNLEARGSDLASFTGALIESDKPIAVIGQTPCTAIPTGYRACDHLVEQLPPRESLSTEYFTVPFYGRGGNVHGDSGDLVRIIAPSDNTKVYINGFYRAQLKSQEYFELFSNEPLHIETSDPVLVMQYITSDGFSSGGEIRQSDPSMTVVPPSQQYLNSYLVNTPTYTIDRHFVNVVIPSGSIPSAILDGNSINPDLFTVIENSEYSFAQIEISSSSHLLEADQLFGIFNYGYAPFESYAYSGGMAFSLPETVNDLSLQVIQPSIKIGELLCIKANAKDHLGRPVNGVRVTFNIDGVHTETGYKFTNQYGEANYCYTGYQLGVDSIDVQVANFTDGEIVDWILTDQNVAPVITSLPDLKAVDGEAFTYQLQVLDPNGDNLSYQLLEAPFGMSVDANGLIYWPSVSWGTYSLDRHTNVVIQVQDEHGATTEQSFSIDEDLPFNLPPAFLVSTPNTQAVQGIPYIYNSAYFDFRLASYKYRLEVEDFYSLGKQRPDAVYSELIQSPDGATIERDDYILQGGAKLDCKGCLQYLHWTPQTTGVFDFEIGINDVRGGIGEPQSFSVDVAPNLPPVITSNDPPTKASVDNVYTYLIAIQNDVPLGEYENLDDLQIVFDQKPVAMKVKLVIDGRAARKYYLEWLPREADVGDHTVNFYVTDRLNRSESQSFNIQVIDGNTAPVITSTANTSSEETRLYEYQLIASDADGDALNYSLLTAPEGMTINANGLVSWVPALGEFESFRYEVWVAVDDGRGGQSSQKYYLSINEFRNHAPEFVPAYRPLTAKVGVEYTHQLQATDREGDLPISYRRSSYQNVGVIDTETGLLRWTPTEQGSYWFSAAATDSLGNYASGNREGWTVQVLPADVLIDAELQLSPGVIDLGEASTLTVVPINEATTPQITLTVDGQPASVNGSLQLAITPERVGRIPIVATITDGRDTVVKTTYLIVRDPTDITPPVVEIHSPTNASDVTAPTQIFGTVQDENLMEVILLYKRANQPIGDNVLIEDFVELYRGPQEFANEAIAELDPTMLLNGSYQILLQATDSNNNVLGRLVTVFVDGDLKIGNFTYTVEDLSIPMDDVPIIISRTYDSRQKSESLDFGYGWSIDYKNVRIEENVEPTRGWTQQRSETNQTFKAGSGYFSASATCIYPALDKSVSVTLPEGQVEKFIVSARPTNGSEPAVTDPNCYLSTERTYDLEFIPQGDTKSELTSVDTLSLYLLDLENGDLNTAGDSVAKPITRYQLTTRTGYIYQLDQNFGIKEIETPNGHKITYQEDGIYHSSGKAVTFTRDGKGRITHITDPANNVYRYYYNGSDDLTEMRDAVQVANDVLGTTYNYNSDHGLVDIIDPLGRPVVKNIYDDSNRLIAQEDGDGNRTNFDHNLDGRESIVTDRNGNISVFYYNDRGDVTSQIDALGNVTLFNYDGNGNQLSKTDALGNTETATFSEKDDQLTQTDALGNTVQFAYNQRGQEVRITDAKGAVFDNSYSPRGQLLNITDPLGNTASNIFTGGSLTSTTDSLGNTTSYTYDPYGNKTTETDSEGNVTTYTHDDNGNILTETRSRTLADTSVVNEITTYEYDAKNRVTATINSLGQRTETEYDLTGQVIAEVDALGRRTEMDYDVYGRVIETRYPDSTTSQKTYDAEGNLLSETNRSNQTTTYEYDALNRQVFVIDANGQRSETVYNEIGQVVAVIDARGNRTEYEYDAVGRRTLTRDALLNEHTFEYDVNGNLTAEVDALNHRKEYTYNALDQRIETRYHDGSTLQETFDAQGRRITQTDQAGITTQYAYDQLSRLSAVIDVQGNRTEYSYDEAGNKLTQTDAEGRATQWTYDALGRVISRRLPLGQTETFTYDSVDNLIAQSDFNGNITIHTYTINNQISRTDFSDGSYEQFTYDNNGNRISAIQFDTSGFTRTTLFAFDNLNRLSSETKPNGTVLAYTYDESGNKKQLTVTLPDTTQQITTYTYDALNRLETVTDTNGTTSYGYDAVGNRASVSYPNNTSQVYSYDTLNRLTQLNTYNAIGTLAQSFDYTLHATGRRLQIDELSGRSTQYTYDNLYRLTSETITDATNGNHTASYEYDRVGNRLYETVNGVQTAYSYDNNDRLLLSGGTVFTYDNQGNTLTQTLDGAVTSYSYNRQHELISQIQAGVTTNFAYNADGIRNAKADSTTTTNFLIDNNLSYAQVIREDNGSQVISYTYGDDLINQTDNGTISYFHYDGLGSTRALSNASGVLTDSYDYEAFGEVLNQTGSTENNYLFAGEQFDSVLDQYYLRARYYSQGTGRFTQQDTYLGNNSDPVSLHKYLYANADPVMYTDPTGNFSISQLSASFNVMGNLARTATTGAARKGIGKALTATARQTILGLRKEITRCSKSKGKKCRIPNLVVIGSDTPESQKHIKDAQIGRGSNGIPISPLVKYKLGANKRRGWLRYTDECRIRKPGNDCDEYPFATSYQGGKSRYRSHTVSLKFIPSWDNQQSGRLWGRAVRGMNQKTFVIAPFGGVSFYIKNGKFGR